MNSVNFNIWLAVISLAGTAILWSALDVFNNKQLLKICIFLNGAGFIAVIMHLRTLLKDNSHLYKAINKIAGDMPV